MAGGTQAIDGLAELGIGGTRIIARGIGRRLRRGVKREPEMRAAKGERVEGGLENRIMRLGPLQSLARSVEGGCPFTLCQQQVAITIALR